MHTIIWSDGSTTSARTWQGLLDKVRGMQWRNLDECEFRHEMAKRAWRWSETGIDIDAPPAEFFRELMRAKLIVIEGVK